jgi:hypothetical protein
MGISWKASSKEVISLPIKGALMLYPMMRVRDIRGE